MLIAYSRRGSGYLGRILGPILSPLVPSLANISIPQPFLIRGYAKGITPVKKSRKRWLNQPGEKRMG
jgi:hypothetical protein